jgi:hypothetical protein
MNESNSSEKMIHSHPEEKPITSKYKPGSKYYDVNIDWSKTNRNYPTRAEKPRIGDNELKWIHAAQSNKDVRNI